MTLAFNLQLRRRDFTLDVAARLPAGPTGVFGRSGAGKTTLLHLLAGLERPDRGSITLDDHTLVDVEAKTWTPPHQRRIGVAFQDARLFPHRTIAANLRYGARTNVDLRTHPLVRTFGLETLLDRRPDQLSGGEQHRVALARLLLSEPAALLFDEPLTGLDEHAAQHARAAIRAAVDAASAPALYVSHRPLDILALTRRLVILDRGRIVGTGDYADLVMDDSPGALLRAHPVENAFSLTSEGLGPGGLPIESPAPPESVVAIGARDISLARDAVTGTTIRNTLPATVTAIRDDHGRTLVRLDAGVPLIAEIADVSRRELGLEPGARVVAMIKASAVRSIVPPATTMPAEGGADVESVPPGRAGHS